MTEILKLKLTTFLDTKHVRTVKIFYIIENILHAINSMDYIIHFGFKFLIFFHFLSGFKKKKLFSKEILKSFFKITLNILSSLGSALFCNYFFKKVEVTGLTNLYLNNQSLLCLKIEGKTKEKIICYDDKQRSYKVF